MAIDLTGSGELGWPKHLKPRGEGFDREEFGTWWERNAHELTHIHPQIAEQWIHRHWRYSPYCNIPISGMTWTIERWSTKRLLSEVRRGNSSKESPSWDYNHLRRFGNEPAKSMDSTGTWNIPVVVLETKGAVIMRDGEHSDIPYWLIEGHQRMRYLNAVHHKATCNATHELFLIRTPNLE